MKIRNILSAAFVIAGIGSATQAAVAPSFVSGYTAGTTAFSGTPTITTTDNANGTTTNAGSFQGGAFSGQSFTTGATGFTLDKLSFVIANGALATNLSIQIYPVTGTVVGGASGTDGKGTSQGAGLGTALLSSGLTFSSTAGGASGLETLDFTGVDEVTLAANTTYYAEIGGLGGDVSIRRSAEVYTNGNAYSRPDTTGTPFTIFGGATRDAPFAFYSPVPEPTALAALSLGGLGLVRRRRA